MFIHQVLSDPILPFLGSDTTIRAPYQLTQDVIRQRRRTRLQLFILRRNAERIPPIFLLDMLIKWTGTQNVDRHAR